MNRKAGVLMPIFSLPSKYGIGCFDQAAYDFVDYLTEAGQTYWQILPLSPTSFGKSDNSPYQSYSAFAGNPYFISLDVLVEEGVLTASEVENGDFGKRPDTIHYKKLNDNRYAILRKAYQRSHVNEDPAYQEFLTNNGWWLNDYALFMALHDFFEGKTWMEWPEDIRMLSHMLGHSVDIFKKPYMAQLVYLIMANGLVLQLQLYIFHIVMRRSQRCDPAARESDLGS